MDEDQRLFGSSGVLLWTASTEQRQGCNGQAVPAVA